MVLTKPISQLTNNKNFKLYAILNNTKKIFGLYWFSKDKIKIIQPNDILSIASQDDFNSKFLIIDSGNYQNLTLQQQSLLTELYCIEERDKCLYEIVPSKNF